MIKSGYVGEIANQLGFGFVIHSRNIFMVDKNDQYLPIKTTDNHFEFSFPKDGENYLLEFNDDTVKLSNSNLESLVISKKNASYVEREKNSSYNKALITIKPAYISFYQNEKIDNKTSRETGFKVYKDMDYLEQSTTYRNENGEFKENIKVGILEDKPVSKHIKRNYNSEGIMINNSVYEEDINIDIPQYIKQTVAENEVVQQLLEKVENMIPGFCELYYPDNKNFKEIINTIQNKKTI